ncbi:unnamed protein product [Phytophthora fragariaefolia]|uniref:Unnamed protein product n=1 Tax=Phytophthora fragariaefolia TaxID=1490495 RepID=A0A9W6XAI3_9STRA|nr:unnamed protein product [Phytophthora fragariaefolia]
MGLRCKLVLLAGYAFKNGVLFYREDALTAFGAFQVVEEDGSEYFAFHKLHWSTPASDLLVIGIISHNCVRPYDERRCTGLIDIFKRKLGGDTCNYPHQFAKNKIAAGPSTFDLHGIS